MRANLDYVWGRPYLDGVTFRYYANIREALFDFESGVLDALPLPFTEAERHQREELDEVLIQTDAATLVYLRLMPQIPNPPAWHNVIKYAVDVNALLQLQYGEKSSQMASIPSTLSYDRVKARRRLKHGGWDGSQTLSLIYAPLPDNAGSAIATRLGRDYLSQIGLQVVVKTTNPDAFQQILKSGSNALALLSMPIPQDRDVLSLASDQTESLIPLYLLPASFLCQPKVRDMNIIPGGVIAFESAWLAK